jgi:hypothetical protein
MQHSGNAKPLLITEYGSLSGGLQEKDYWLRVSILSSFLMRFLARPDEIQLAVPFLLGYMHWEPGSGSALIHKSPTGEFYYTRNIFFIQLWEDVGGEYVFVNSPDPKVHVQAWAENARLWVAVNNHSGNRLSMFPHAFLTEDSSRALKSVHVRHPAYQEGEFKFIQKRLGPEEAYLLPVSDTLLFCFEFEQEPVARCHLLKQSFYADRIGHRLENGQQAAFHIRLSDDIPLAELECVVIRLGLLDGMGRGIAPELSFNGRTLAMPFALPTAVSFEHLRIEASPGQVLQDNVLQVRVPEEGDPIGISHVALELYYRHEQ